MKLLVQKIETDTVTNTKLMLIENISNQHLDFEVFFEDFPIVESNTMLCIDVYVVSFINSMTVDRGTIWSSFWAHRIDS